MDALQLNRACSQAITGQVNASVDADMLESVGYITYIHMHDPSILEVTTATKTWQLAGLKVCQGQLACSNQIGLLRVILLP